MSIHFFEVMLILMFVFDYKVPFLLLLFGLVMYIEHLRFNFADYLVNTEIIKDYQNDIEDEKPKDNTDAVR